VILAIGAAAAVVLFFAARHETGLLVICFAPVLYGLLDIARGLATVKTARQLEALRRPLSERKPWLFAQPPSGMDPGWYPDPTNAVVQRWYDGDNWTEDTRTAPASA
jgi:hypothetical protein